MTSMIKQRIFIGICYHKPAPIVSTQYLVPIHVGKKQSSVDLGGMLGDDTGGNISGKNKNWCELTALYWMKHNVKAEYYGLMHYRRILNFNPRNRRGGSFYKVEKFEINRFGWTDSLVEAAVKDNDIVTSPTWNIHPPGASHIPMTNEEMYAHQHNLDDLIVIEDIIREHYPQIYPYFIQVITARQLFFGNVAIMRAPFFEGYTDFLFDALERAESIIDISSRDAYQARIWGFLAERLTNVYVAYAKCELNAKVISLPQVHGVFPPYYEAHQVSKYKQIFFSQQQRLEKKIGKIFVDEDLIDIVLCIDERFMPHAAVTLLSTIRATDYPERIRFTIISGEQISPSSSEKLSCLVNEFGSKICFECVDDRQLGWLPLNRQHVSIATYYRLIIADLLPATVKKVIYLDADTVVLDDIKKLWDHDLEGYPIGACPDEGGLMQSRRLGLSVSHRYFNAGIVVLDVEKLRAIDLVTQTQNIYRRYGPYITLQDQDILNILFCDKTSKLPLRWNVGQRMLLGNDLEPSYTHQEAVEAASSPAIIHFTDSVKPWNIKSYNPYAEFYWYFRNSTPWAKNRSYMMRRWLVSMVRRYVVHRNRKFFSHTRN